MVWHEVFGILGLAIVGVVFVSALSPNAATAGVIKQSFSGFNGTLAAISGPVGTQATGG